MARKYTRKPTREELREKDTKQEEVRGIAVQHRGAV